MPPSFQTTMIDKIKIKSLYTGTKIFVEPMGEHLLYDSYSGRIYLASNKNLLIRAKFEIEFGRLLTRSIIERYGERLGWLGWESWLSKLQQIHNVEPDNYIFGEFITALEQVDGVITREIAQEIMQCVRNQAQ